MNLPKYKCWPLLISGMLAMACVSESPIESYEQAHQQMLDLLKAIPSQLSPENNLYANQQRADFFLQKAKFSEGSDQIRNLGIHGQELLYAGKTERALQVLDSVKQLLELHDLKESSFYESVQDVTGIGWMRLGEQQNCILHHNHQSCIIPIQKDGIHQAREGSETAIQQFQEILKQNPHDYTTRWLLNLAYMTLGEYPDQVPKSLLIPSEAFEETIHIQRFPEIATKVGLDVTGLSGGSIVDDLNNDGRFDIVATSWGISDQLRIFYQNERGQFEDQTEALGLLGITGGLNLVQADYDNDGFVDILVLRGAWMELDGRQPNSLLKNMAGTRFMDVTSAVGLLSFHPTQNASWADMDLDGDLDLFIGNESTPGCSNPCELYENDGHGRFANIAATVGLDIRDYIKGSIWNDYDHDGDMDLYVTNLNGPNYFFRNEGIKDGLVHFFEMGGKLNIQDPQKAFPCWFFDYDQDGWDDLFVSGYQADPGDFAKEMLGEPTRAELPRLYHNEGDGTFKEVTGLTKTDKVLYTMGSNFGDLNNDNYPDFYIGTGDPDFRAIIPNRMFLNIQGQYFDEVTYQGGFGHLQKGHGVSFADLDRDGDQDLFSVIGGALQGDVYQNVLFENPEKDQDWISFKLQGTQSNRSAIGTRIALTFSDGNTYYKTVNSGGSFGCNPLEMHFGIPRDFRIIDLTLHWPVSGIQKFSGNLIKNHRYLVTEGQEELVTERLISLPLQSMESNSHPDHHEHHK